MVVQKPKKKNNNNNKKIKKIKLESFQKKKFELVIYIYINR